MRLSAYHHVVALLGLLLSVTTIAAPVYTTDTDAMSISRPGLATSSHTTISSTATRPGPSHWVMSRHPGHKGSSTDYASGTVASTTGSASYRIPTTSYLTYSSTTSKTGHIYMTSAFGGEAYVMRTMNDDGEYGSTTYAMRMSDATATVTYLATATSSTSATGYIYVTFLASATAYVWRTMDSNNVYGSTTYAMASQGTVTMMD